MCSYLAAIAAAATVAGTAMTNAGQQQARQAQTDAVNNEEAQQAALIQKEQGSFNDSLQKSNATTIMANQQADTAARLKAMQANGSVNGVSVLPQQAADESTATKKATQQLSDTATGQLQQQAQGSAALGGLNDAFHTAAITTAPNAADIGIDANFGQGDANLLPIELAAASRKGSGLRSIGSLFSGLGAAASAGAGAAALGGAAAAGGSALANAAPEAAAGAGAAEGTGFGLSSIPLDTATSVGQPGIFSGITSGIGQAVQKGRAFLNKPIFSP